MDEQLMEKREFRNAMGRFATGVTVITANDTDGPRGMTANAFMSVSLEPKLIVVSIDNQANMLNTIKHAKQFAVNVLSDQQVDLSMHFAKQKELEVLPEFDVIEGVPTLPGALCTVVCNLHKEVIAGDHTLYIGEVTDLKMSEGKPLTFFSGRYGRLQEEAEF